MKKFLLSALYRLQLHNLFRFIHRRKILVLAYHGITEKRYDVAPWTLIHRDVFEEQLEYVSRRYRVVSLRLVAEAMAGKRQLPQRSAALTFDDGYRNNLTLALPILQKYRVPATIFLTAGYINTSQLLHLDEACVIVSSSGKRGRVSIPQIGIESLGLDSPRERNETCAAVVKWMKRQTVKERKRNLELLRETFGCDDRSYDRDLVEACRMLTWDETRRLKESGLIDMGAHTVFHEILSNLSLAEATAEIIKSKAAIEENLHGKVDLFAYPNGQAGDFGEEHIETLRKSGFCCSVTTIPQLNPLDMSPFEISRFSVGPDSSLDLPHFALRTSGAFAFQHP